MLHAAAIALRDLSAIALFIAMLATWSVILGGH
jgi:hypothetical protein